MKYNWPTNGPPDFQGPTYLGQDSNFGGGGELFFDVESITRCFNIIYKHRQC